MYLNEEDYDVIERADIMTNNYSSTTEETKFLNDEEAFILIRDLLDLIENSYLNETINELNNKIDAQDKIINTQALEIARLKEWKEDLLNENIELENIRKEAIEILKGSAMFYCEEDRQWLEQLFKSILEILGDKENDKDNR